MTTTKKSRKPTAPREFLIPRGNMRGPELEEAIRQLAIRCGGLYELKTLVDCVILSDQWHQDMATGEVLPSLEAHVKEIQECNQDDTGSCIDDACGMLDDAMENGRELLPQLFSRGDHKTA